MDITIDPICGKEEMQESEGAYFDCDATWHILSPETCAEPLVYVRAGDSGRLLCCVARKVIPRDLCDLAVACFKHAGEMVSTNRGVAAGLPHRTRKNGFERGVPVHSSIAGYIDSTRHDRPCRLTAFSREHFDEYTRGLAFVREVNRCFARYVPEAYLRQYSEAEKTGSEFHIVGTAFSTVTVNKDFRTALHRDAGDFKPGMGNLVVCADGIHGGLLLFPRYKLAVQAETGDYMAIDVHEPHCNSPITKLREDGYRMSFVLYLRERMSRCAEINRRLGLTGSGSKMTSEDMCRSIFAAVGEELPEKRVTGEGRSGIKWWCYEGARFCISYKGKAYKMLDKETGQVICNLWPSLEYAKNIQMH